MLTEKIGACAMLEQTAEECAELVQACLKIARYYRKENPVYKKFDELEKSLAEETADVLICIEELIDAEIVDEDLVNTYWLAKINRMKKRLERLEKEENK